MHLHVCVPSRSEQLMNPNQSQGDLISVTTTVVLGDFSSPSVGKLKLRANTGGAGGCYTQPYY